MRVNITNDVVNDINKILAKHGIDEIEVGSVHCAEQILAALKHLDGKLTPVKRGPVKNDKQ